MLAVGIEVSCISDSEIIMLRLLRWTIIWVSSLPESDFGI